MTIQAHTFQETALELVSRIQRFDPFGNPEDQGFKAIREGLQRHFETRGGCDAE
jgi:hypothetical protein